MFVRSARPPVQRVQQRAIGDVVRDVPEGEDAEHLDELMGQRFAWTVDDAVARLHSHGSLVSKPFVSQGVLWHLMIRTVRDDDTAAAARSTDARRGGEGGGGGGGGGGWLSLELHATLARDWQAGEAVSAAVSFDLPDAPPGTWWRRKLLDGFEATFIAPDASGVAFNRLLNYRRLEKSLYDQDLVVHVELYGVAAQWRKDSTHVEARYARAAQQHGMYVAMADTLGVRHGMYGMTVHVRQEPASASGGEFSVSYSRGAFRADSGMQLLSVLLLDNLLCHFGGDGQRAMLALPQVLGLLYDPPSDDDDDDDDPQQREPPALVDEYGRDVSYILEPCSLSPKSPEWRPPASLPLQDSDGYCRCSDGCCNDCTSGEYSSGEYSSGEYSSSDNSSSSESGTGSGDGGDVELCDAGAYWDTLTRASIAAAAGAAASQVTAAAEDGAGFKPRHETLCEKAPRDEASPDDKAPAGEASGGAACCEAECDEGCDGGGDVDGPYGLLAPLVRGGVRRLLARLERVMPSWTSLLVAFLVAAPVCMGCQEVGAWTAAATRQQQQQEQLRRAAGSGVSESGAVAGGPQLRRSLSSGSSGGGGSGAVSGRHEAPSSSNSRGGRCRWSHGSRQKRSGASGARPPRGSASTTAAATATVAPAATAGLTHWSPVGAASDSNNGPAAPGAAPSLTHCLLDHIPMVLSLIIFGVWALPLKYAVALGCFGCTAAAVSAVCDAHPAAATRLLGPEVVNAPWYKRRQTCRARRIAEVEQMVREIYAGDGVRNHIAAAAAAADANAAVNAAAAAAQPPPSRTSSKTSHPGSPRSTLPLVAAFAAAFFDAPNGSEPSGGALPLGAGDAATSRSVSLSATRQGDGAAAAAQPAAEQQQRQQPQPQQQRPDRAVGRSAAARQQQRSQRSLSFPTASAEPLQQQRRQQRPQQQHNQRPPGAQVVAAEGAPQHMGQRPAAQQPMPRPQGSRTAVAADASPHTARAPSLSDPNLDLQPALDQTGAQRIGSQATTTITNARPHRAGGGGMKAKLAAADAARSAAAADADGGSGGGGGDTHLCLVCLDAPRLHGFLHGGSMHIGVCGGCAELLLQRQLRSCQQAGGEAAELLCPVCREPVERMVAIFS